MLGPVARMERPMDPYHKWFGIAPFEQPANHYRLLGIRNFESDKDVIESAANQRMAYLQELSGDPDSVADAQRLLNEVSNARLTLLSDEKKRAYDEGLKHGLDSMPIAKHSVEAVSDLEISPVPPASRSEGASGKRRTNKTGWPAPALVSIVVLTATIVALAGVLLFREEAVPAKPPSRPPPAKIALKKQKGVPDAQDDVAPPRQETKETDRPARKDDHSTTSVKDKDAQAPETPAATEEHPPKNETDAEFPIGGLIDTPSEARVAWQGVNEHVHAQPSGDHVRCRFRLPGFDDAHEVFLVGSFNGWNTTAERMQHNNGTWETIVSLKPDEYEYKFIVDGTWQPDGENNNYRLELVARDVPNNRQPEVADLSREQSREDALTILDGAGLHESKPGVWSLNKTTSFAQRDYERLKKDPDVRRALKTVGGRLPGQ